MVVESVSKDGNRVEKPVEYHSHFLTKQAGQLGIWQKQGEPTTTCASARGDAAAALEVPTLLTVDLLTYIQ